MSFRATIASRSITFIYDFQPCCTAPGEQSSAFSHLKSFGSFSGRKTPLIIAFFNNFFVLKHTLLSLTSHLCFAISISMGNCCQQVCAHLASLTAFAIAAFPLQKLPRGLHLPSCLNFDNLGALGSVSAIQKHEGKKRNVFLQSYARFISVPITFSLGRNKM